MGFPRNKEELSEENLTHVTAIIFGNPRERFSAKEVGAAHANDSAAHTICVTPCRAD